MSDETKPVGAQPGCPKCGGIPCANLDVCKAPAPDLEQQLTDAAFPVGSNSANAQLVVDLGEAIDIVARSRTGSSPERAAHPESRGAGAEPDELVVEIARELYDRFAMGGWEPQDAYGSIVIWLERARTAPPSSPGAPQTVHAKDVPLCGTVFVCRHGSFANPCKDCQGTFVNSSSPGADTEQK